MRTAEGVVGGRRSRGAAPRGLIAVAVVLAVIASLSWANAPQAAAVDPSTTFVVTGTVTDTGGSGVEGICVQAEAWADGSYAPSVETTTAADGTYRIEIELDGSLTQASSYVDLWDCDESRAPRYWLGDEGAGYWTTPDLEPGDNVFDRVAVRAGLVEVTVRDEQGDVLDDCELREPEILPGVPQEVHVPYVACDGVVYADVFIGDTRDPAKAEVLNLSEGEIVQRTITARPAGTISGAIVDASTGGTASSCVQVYERFGDVRGFASQRVWPTEGVFQLTVASGASVLEFGPCTFPAFEEPFPYVQQFYDGKASVDQADPVSVSAGQETSVGQIRMMQPGDGNGGTPPTPPPPPVDGGPFSDVPVDHAFADEIRWLSESGITGGFRDGTFRPAAQVTRQAMAAFFYRQAGSPAFDPPAQPSFSDVGTGHPFYLEIEWLADSEITGGFGDGTFQPSGTVTRQATAAFFYRHAGLD